MILPGRRNAITDIDGLLVGNAEDPVARSGVTVVLPAVDTVRAAVDVRGGAPGTINTDALTPGGLIRSLHGIVLSGGSAFGLEAASGLMTWLSLRDRGFKGFGPAIPVVAGAILFDMANGGDKGWGATPPYRSLALVAADRAKVEFELGNVGAGLGATAGPIKGGLGTASAFDESTGVTLGALVAVNSVGSVTMPGEPSMWAWYLEQQGEAGGQPLPRRATGHAFATKAGIAQDRPGMNTTVGVIATDAPLDNDELKRLAIHAQDGLALAIRPIHTLYDGDTIFAVTTGTSQPAPRDDLLVRLGAIAADVMARAVMRGVYNAQAIGEIPSYQQLYGARPSVPEGYR